MARSTTKAPSAVKVAAQALRRIAMASEEGSFLGSEDDLVARLGISRPTLRQAAAQVAQEHFVTIRRGVGGGYFTNSPSSMTVARVAAIYLQTHDAQLEEVVRAIEPIRTEIARLAACNIAGEDREAMKRFLEDEQTLDRENFNYRAFLRSEREFSKLTGAASGNRVLSLFFDILYDFSGLIEPGEIVFVNAPDSVALYLSYRIRMAIAILEGDEELAVLNARRCSAVTTAWMLGDMPSRGFDVQTDDLDPLMAAYLKGPARQLSK